LVDLELFDEHGVYVQEFTLHGHIGTHIDVPAHLFADGTSTSSKDISSFVGTAQVFDCSKYVSNKIIGLDIFNEISIWELPDFVLLYTGWDKKWGTHNYFNNYPTLSEDAIATLAKTKIKGIGLDTGSLDSMHAQIFQITK
jgi:kynurenine formamidase